MNIIDVFIILFFISSLVRGVDLGVIRQLFSTAGFLGGLFLGAFIQGKVVHTVHTASSKAILALVVIGVTIGVVTSIGEYIGIKIKRRLEQTNVPIINGIDRSLGSVTAGVTLLLGVWLGAAMFGNIPQSSLQKQIKSSVIIAQLNKSLPSAPSVVSRLSHLIDPNSFPNVFTGLEPAIDTNRPLPTIGDLDGAVKKARASTVKVEGQGCGGITQGSGFVADTNLVITNAHVVAGVEQPYIIDSNGKHAAQVISFDPNLDIAVLRASNLAGQPLTLKEGIAANGTSSAILGYPGGGDFTAGPAAVIDSFKAVGRNIYNQNETTREVYSVKGTIRPGNSGGPLVNANGDVIGVVFAESTTYDDVGYALTIDAVISSLNQAKDHNSVVATGSCAE